MTNLEVIQSKIYTVESLKSFLNIWRFKGYKIVFTNGCFDIIHRGHIEYLSKAADLGNILIVGLNSDSSVRKIKGESRPVQDEEARKIILASLHFVDAVIVFDEETPYSLINLIKPDIIVKGSDYAPEEIVGYTLVKEYGGKVVTIELTEGYSTTNIIERIKGSNQ